MRVGPINFQPGEFAKICLALFFAAYLVEKRELLAMASWKVGPLRLPEPRHLGPIVVAWALLDGDPRRPADLGSSLLFFTLFVVMLWVATERPAYLAIGGVLFAASAYLGLPPVRPRARPRRHLARPVAQPRPRRRPDRPGHLRVWRGAG